MWGIICGLDNDLAKVGLHLNETLFFDDSRSCLDWDLELDGNFSVNSPIRVYDSCTLDSHTTITLRCKVVPKKINTSV